MPLYVGAVFKSIGAKSNSGWITPTAFINHSDAGYVRSLQNWWLNTAPSPNGSGSLSCHFHIAWDGYMEQYVDTLRRANANVQANTYAISVEVSNSPSYRDGRISFNDDPYSEAQIRALVQLHKWVLATHPGIPAKKCTDGRHGLGWHNQYPQWTTPGHQCPGTKRIELLQTRVWPEVFTQEEDELTPDEKKSLKKIEQRTEKINQTNWFANAAMQIAGRAWDWSVASSLEILYQQELGRSLDPGGLKTWMREAKKGKSFSEIQAMIHRSGEAKRHRGEA